MGSLLPLSITRRIFFNYNLFQITYKNKVLCQKFVLQCQPWMKEVKGIRHGGGGAYLSCPVFTTVQFSLREEGSSEYIRVCEGRESLWPNF